MEDVGKVRLALGQVCYGLVEVVRRFETKYLRGEPRLGEPFSADVVRDMYRTLEYLGIPDPETVRILRNAERGYQTKK